MRSSDRLSWMILAAGALHVLEEGLCGWVAWAHRFMPGVTWTLFGVGNALFLAYLVVGPRTGRPVIVLSAPWLLLLNVPVHLVPTLRTGIWSPGLATALLLYVPLGMWCLRDARRRGTSGTTLLQAAMLAAFLMVLPFLLQALRLRIAS